MGISAGLGVALPLAAYAATLPLDGVNDAVRMDAMPFAAGIVAGVGMLTLTAHLLDARADRLEAEEAEAAQFASIFSDADPVVAQTAGSRFRSNTADDRNARAARAAKGVPVIARAADALDEAEAWAEIDAMFSDDSPISCDPVRSKDMYQIALEELHRAEQAAQERAAAEARRAAEVQEEQTARAAAMSALYGAAAAVDSPMRGASVGSGALGVSAVPNAASSAFAPAATTNSFAASATYTTPVADYSGHEDMWASAISILEETEEPRVSEAPSAVRGKRFRNAAQPASAPQPYAAAGTAQTPAFSPAASSTAFVPRSRMAAVAEGGAATNVHRHVNDLVEEELAKVVSKSVRTSTYEFLSVIDGGTASMPRLKTAEA